MKDIKVLISLILITFSVNNCVSPGAKDFSIYLPAKEISCREMSKVDLDNLKLADKPILSVEDIISYEKDTHKIELTPSAYERFRQLRVFGSSTAGSGIPFVVCVNRKPIYWGAFWSGVSSWSFNGVVIMERFGADKQVIQIELGYPSLKFFKGKDPRSNKEILQSLKQAGKLR